MRKASRTSITSPLDRRRGGSAHSVSRRTLEFRPVNTLATRTPPRPVEHSASSSDDIFGASRLDARDRRTERLVRRLDESRLPIVAVNVGQEAIGASSPSSPRASSAAIKKYLSSANSSKLCSLSSETLPRKPLDAPPDWPKRPRPAPTASPSRIPSKEASPSKDVLNITSDDGEDILDPVSKILYPDDKHQPRTRPSCGPARKRLSPNTELRAVLLQSIQLGEFYKEDHNLALICNPPLFEITFANDLEAKYLFISMDVEKVYVFGFASSD